MKVFFKLIFVVLFIMSSCGYYSFKGSLPSHIKTVAVPLFDNNTAEPNVRDDLTNMVVDAFIEDNSLTITDESNADLIISGTITNIPQPKASIVSSGEQVEEYHLTVNVKVKCEDIVNNKVLWEKSFSEYGVMESIGSDEDRQIALTAALEKITEDILNNTLGYW